ncbi:hypothetical protein ACFOOJ_14110, partial [Sphingobium xenophagum]|uniref:hypothetical protein n=1 Tax=Sphingobium xenophagum TaxID=121428 RepID=UPI00360F88DA
SKSPTNTLQHHSFHAASIRTVDPTRKSSGSSRCPIVMLLTALEGGFVSNGHSTPIEPGEPLTVIGKVTC